jgi:hypothetical protein
VLGVAGWAGIPLGVASSCFLALGVGVGLDYGIHLGLGGYEEEGGKGAIRLRVLANVATVGTGLSVLLLSSNPTIARLGLLIVLSMVASGYTASVTFDPARRAKRAGGGESPESSGGMKRFLFLRRYTNGRVPHAPDPRPRIPPADQQPLRSGERDPAPAAPEGAGAP